MALRTWVSGAAATYDVWRFAPANVEVGDTFSLGAGGKFVTFTATVASVANVVAGLVAAWNASGLPQHRELVAANYGPDTHVELTGQIAGLPCEVTSQTTDGGGTNTQSLTGTHVTTATGPNDYNNPVNWLEGVVPADGDDVLLAAPYSILYGLDQSGVTLASLTCTPAFTGGIGLPAIRPAIAGVGIPSYAEYRLRDLTIGIDLLTIGDDLTPDRGAGLYRFDTGATPIVGRLFGATVGSDEGQRGPVFWKGTANTNSWQVTGGRLDVISTAAIKYLTVSRTGTVYTGGGVTFNSGGLVTQSGGLFSCASAVPSFRRTGGKLIRNPGFNVTAWDYTLGAVQENAT